MAWTLATLRDNRPIWINTNFAASMERVDGRPPLARVIFGQSDNRSQTVEVLETPEALLAGKN